MQFLDISSSFETKCFTLVSNEISYLRLSIVTFTYRVEVVEELTEGRLEDPVHAVTYQVLYPLQQLVKRDERAFTLYLGVLGKMAACARLLGAIRLGNTEHVAHAWHNGLQIELGRLGEICL